MPDFEPFELFVDVRECPVPAVAGRTMELPTSAVLVDIVMSLKLPAVACLWCPGRLAGGSVTCLRAFTSNGPGAIVFILWSSPPLVAVLGLTGAYIRSGSGGLLPSPPYPPPPLF
jgi:hypothetical protein